MTTLASVILPPSSREFRPVARPASSSSSEGTSLLIAFKRAPSHARTIRAPAWRCKAHLDRIPAGASVEEFEPQSGEEPSDIPLHSVRGPGFAGAASISSHLWEWRHRWNIHYEAAGVPSSSSPRRSFLEMLLWFHFQFESWAIRSEGMENTDAPALLLLPGFGVGSFHFAQQLRDLGRDYRVWAIDFLGQGKSWPSHDPAPQKLVLELQANAKPRDWGFGNTPEPWAQDLVYSVDTWRDQVHAFIDKVIGGPVFIVGNSLGGYVGAYVAATNPELVNGIALLNATPFWAFMPNARRSPLLSKLVPWGGLLPVPILAKTIISIWWNLLRNPVTVKKMIALVYADRSVINDTLIQQMLEATDHPAAFAAFASIIFAPQPHSDFGQNLTSLKEVKTPTCMIYGKEDPWVVPFWGQRAKQRNPDAIYYELSPVGHCPHHEAPEVVNNLVRKWVESLQSQGALQPALLDTGVDQKRRHWFVVVNEGNEGNEGNAEKRVSVRVKGTQGFLGNLVDSLREFFMARCPPQSPMVETLEDLQP